MHVNGNMRYLHQIVTYKYFLNLKTFKTTIGKCSELSVMPSAIRNHFISYATHCFIIPLFTEHHFLLAELFTTILNVVTQALGHYGFTSPQAPSPDQLTPAPAGVWSTESADVLTELRL